MVEPLLPLELMIAKQASASLSPTRLRAFPYTLACLYNYLLKIFGVLCCVCVGVGFSSEVLLCLLVP